jgi:hypothetical protein
LPGAAKLESFGPEPPAKPLPRADPNTLPLPSAPNPEAVVLPKPKPETGLSPERPPKPPVVVVDVELGDFAPASEPKPDVDDAAAPPKTLGLDAPIAPNGEVVDEARELKPELANAEADVCGLSLRPLPNVGLGEDARDFCDVSESADVALESRGSAAAICDVSGG